MNRWQSIRTCLLASLIWLPATSCMLPTLLFRHDVIETLHKPVQVSGWEKDGLQLADGKKLQLPDFKALPVDSAMLREATSRGVEIDKSGRVIGIVRVWHWCGNDIVRRHEARVDVANVLSFLGEGERTTKLPLEIESSSGVWKKDGIGEQGWRVGEFHTFKDWEKDLKKQLRKAPANQKL